eukprot:386021-Amphidinium_carterae.1
MMQADQEAAEQAGCLLTVCGPLYFERKAKVHWDLVSAVLAQPLRSGAAPLYLMTESVRKETLCSTDHMFSVIKFFLRMTHAHNQEVRMVQTIMRSLSVLCVYARAQGVRGTSDFVAQACHLTPRRLSLPTPPLQYKRSPCWS